MSVQNVNLMRNAVLSATDYTVKPENKDESAVKDIAESAFEGAAANAIESNFENDDIFNDLAKASIGAHTVIKPDSDNDEQTNSGNKLVNFLKAIIGWLAQ